MDWEKNMNLYKFQTVSTRSLDALLKHSLYFAETRKLNDATEGMFNLLDMYDEDLYLPDFTDLEKFGVLAMAKGESHEVEQSPFMWAHYGNQLEGFCLVFNFEEFVSDIRQDIYLHRGVRYVNGRSFPGLIKPDSGLEEVAGTDFKASNKKAVCRSCFFQKPKEFVNEREYRFLSETSGLKHYHIESLSKVIIGERMDLSDKTVLLSTLESLGLSDKVEYARTKNNSFKIHITKRDQ